MNSRVIPALVLELRFKIRHGYNISKMDENLMSVGIALQDQARLQQTLRQGLKTTGWNCASKLSTVTTKFSPGPL